jgi:phosphate transport system substrate-binding protein
LDAGKCDIGMASRAISDDEASKLARLGTMRSAASEHVVALDGIAVIVHRNNPISELSRTDIGRIFAGEVTNWKEIHPAAGDQPIHIYARDDKSGTFDTFKNVVLQGKKLASAQRFESSEELSDKVSTDTAGIGFIGLPYVRSSKAVKVSDGSTTAFLPNQFTVATEDYPISRRLYFYSTPNSANPLVNEFIEFALSDEGQKVVEAHGFIRANADEMTSPSCTNCSFEYKSITQNARRVSINFRFRAGGKELDTKAVRDLDRVVTMLRNRPDLASKQVLLLGFSDNDGDPQRNMQLSTERATIVAKELISRGIQPAVIKGFGDQSPVATNLTPEGKEKNRRVELWFQ